MGSQPSALQQSIGASFSSGPVRPFLKWAGGKSRLLKTISIAAPEQFNRYFEPFLGGAAVFLGLRPLHATLGDSNQELISCYEMVRDSPHELIAALKKFRVSEEDFYRVRSLRVEELSRLDRAARFIYLNKTCYNGVYRVNKRGDFNTPYGRYENVALVDAENLIRVSEVLKGATLVADDYRSVLRTAGERDFIYLDPPYFPIGQYSDFRRYTKEFFYEADHVRLSETFKELDEKGCFVLLSNSYSDRIASLYSQYFQMMVEVPRFVNCKADRRGRVRELLISNYPIMRSTENPVLNMETIYLNAPAQSN